MSGGTQFLCNSMSNGPGYLTIREEKQPDIRQRYKLAIITSVLGSNNWRFGSNEEMVKVIGHIADELMAEDIDPGFRHKAAQELKTAVASSPQREVIQQLADLEESLSSPRYGTPNYY